jgi:hypothetical protein
VTVNGGTITAIAPGAAEIVGTFDGVTGHQAVNVSVGCAFTIVPDMISVAGGGGSQAVTIAAAPVGCAPSAWTATANDAAVSVSPAAGDGNGTVTVTVSKNSTTGVQSHAATIAGQMVRITQSGTEPTPPEPPAPSPAPPVPPAPPPTVKYTLRLTLVEGQELSGPHAGTVTGPDGFTCTFGLSKGDGACSQSFPAGSAVRLVVKLAWPGFPPGAPVPDDRPISWTKGCDSVIGLDTCVVNVNGDRNVTIGIGAS